MGHVARMGKQDAYKLQSEKSEGKRPFMRPRYKWELGIKMYLKETRRDGLKWIRLPQDRVQWRAWFCEHGTDPSGSIKGTGHFLIR